MLEVGAYDVKPHWPQLLEHTQRGEHFVMTKHGRPVAELIPVARNDGNAVRTIANIRSFRETLRKRGVRMQGLLKKDEGLCDLAHQRHRY